MKRLEMVFSCINGTKERHYNNYKMAEKYAKKHGLTVCEYGDLYASDKSYCCWNKTGNRKDGIVVYAEYFFINGVAE